MNLRPQGLFISKVLASFIQFKVAEGLGLTTLFE